MITKKEDLIDCYVNGRNEELARVFQEMLFSFGIKWLHFNDQDVRIPKDEYEYICFDGEFISWNRELYTKEHYKTELTLSDFKPTKEESAIKTLEMLGYAYHGAELWEPPVKKPRTRTEYEKVTESIFDLREEFERGELYFAANGDIDNMRVIESELHLVQLLKSQMEFTDRAYIYRRTEKQVDWREDVSNFVDDKYSYITIHENGAVDALLAASSNINFLELCRVALRANGELD